MSNTTATKPETAKSKTDKLDELKRRHEILAARIKDIEAREKSQKRKDETRLKVLAGAALLADLDHHIKQDPNSAAKRRADIVALLNRAIQKKNDREFLQAMGWL